MLHFQAKRNVKTGATTDIPADLDLTQQRSVRIEGRDVDSYLGWVGTPPFNLLNRYPALAVPTGLARTGVPTSNRVQGNASVRFRLAK